MALRWILLFPLIGALLNGIVWRPKKAAIAGAIGSLGAFAAFLVSCGVVSALSNGADVTDAWFTWIQAGRIKIDFLLEATPVTGLMLMVVTGIGTLIHIYAAGYMSHDKSPSRFFAYLNLFLAAMLTLVLSGDLVGVFMGWEGVGLCSYLLIGFWHEDDANAAAGMKAFVTNRVGDLGFILALLVLLTYVGTSNIRELLAIFSDPTKSPELWVSALAAAGLFWASTGKSAQIPLFIWLPDAMAGPTPVSALIHAATMVTSGVFVTVRLWPMFAANEAVLHAMMWGGLATAWLAALTALTQRDIKKVLAYSTVSQLGFMFVALGVGSPTGALFHVVTHACFKALLFLGAGSVIHGMHHKQDLFEMGGLKKKMPVTHVVFLVATLAIIGFPLTSGFFSKDMILAKAYEASPVAYVLLLGAALLTAFYMFRLYALAFWGTSRSDEASHAHESPIVMTAPLMVLAVLSVFAGWIETPVVIGDIHRLQSWVEGSWYGHGPAAHGEEHALSHAMEWGLMGLTSLLSLSIAYFAFSKYGRFKGASGETSVFKKLSENKFYVDEIYDTVIVRPLSALARFSSDWIEGRLINGLAHLSAGAARGSGQVLSILHAGNLQAYAWYLAAGTGVILLMTWSLGVWK